MREGIVVKGIGATVVLALGMLVALGVQTASAHKKVHQSEVTLEVEAVNGDQETAWHGEVTSRRARCTRNRKVELYRRFEGSEELIGKDLTGSEPGAAHNEYVIYQDGYPPDEGGYVAIAKRKVLRRTSRHRHVCAQRASDGIAFIECPPSVCGGPILPPSPRYGSHAAG